MLDDLRRDVVFAVRSLAKSPGFTVVAVLAIALAIVSVSLLLLVVAQLASFLPARRAVSVDPLATLSSE